MFPYPATDSIELRRCTSIPRITAKSDTLAGYVVKESRNLLLAHSQTHEKHLVNFNSVVSHVIFVFLK